MKSTSTWSSRIEQGKLPDARRGTMNSTECPKLKQKMSLGEFCGPNKGSLSLCQRINDPGPAYWFRFTPVGTSFLPHPGDKKGAILPQKPITPYQIASLVCGLTAAPRAYWYGHRQSCPGVTQAVSYDPLRFPSHPKVIKILRKHTSSGVTLQHPNPRLCVSTHLRPAHRFPDAKSTPSEGGTTPSL